MINPITGYDITKDECGKSTNRESQIPVTPVTFSSSNVQPLYDDSETEWLYN